MNNTIYKIVSNEIDSPKIELVRILKIKKKTVEVISIIDGYKFEYIKKYFNNKKQLATKKDIKNYKFELNC